MTRVHGQLARRSCLPSRSAPGSIPHRPRHREQSPLFVQPRDSPAIQCAEPAIPPDKHSKSAARNRCREPVCACRRHSCSSSSSTVSRGKIRLGRLRDRVQRHTSRATHRLGCPAVKRPRSQPSTASIFEAAQSSGTANRLPSRQLHGPYVLRQSAAGIFSVSGMRHGNGNTRAHRRRNSRLIVSREKQSSEKRR